MTDSDPIHLEFPDLPCNQFVELVTEYLDDALTPEERARVDEHLGICEACASVLAQWRLVIEMAGELRHDEVEAIDPSTRESLMTAFRRARPSR
jgi:anti-sigma factor RsiW